MRADGVVYYLHGDHPSLRSGQALGSTSLVTTGAGAEVARQLYLPYGAPRWGSGTLPTDFTFTGQRADATGLMYFRARYYAAGLGRFVSADTLVPNPGNPQDLNRYSYVRNSPVKYTDPTGHCTPGVNCPGDKNDDDPHIPPPINPRPVLPQAKFGAPPIIGGQSWLRRHHEAELRSRTQDQLAFPPYDRTGCACFSQAMAINLLTGGNHAGVDVCKSVETAGIKGEAVGLLPMDQANSLNYLARRMNPKHPPFVATYKTGGTPADLIDNLHKGYPTIVSVSWGSGFLWFPVNNTGHALVVVGYNSANGQFSFLDPNGGRLLRDFSRYGFTFDQAWRNQPNWFIPSGAMVTVKPN